MIQQSPSVALGNAKQEVVRMGEVAVQGLEETNQFLQTKQVKHANNANQIEEAINNFDRKIMDYLVRISAESLSAQESEEHGALIDAVSDIERIGDHFENIIELVEYQQSNKVKVSSTAMEDLTNMFLLTTDTVRDAMVALQNNDKEQAKLVVEQENKIDSLERKLRKQHIQRLTEGSCSGQSGVVFIDIISNLERIGDHAVNIAEAVLGESKHMHSAN